MIRMSTKKSDIATTLDASLNVVHVGDSRHQIKKIPADFVNVTITSPPYFDLKDYGVDGQIGFGQKYEDYLVDLTKVFSEVFRCTKSDGSLWVVIDTFRKEQEVFPLPFDLAARLKVAGWVLRDIIIWKKERTLPWVKDGTTRRIFEYILVFSKGAKSFHYDPDKYRQTSDLKRWWVRYPERYNPSGKSLEEIWSYDIPTQGSWGEKYVRHFCPLPSELVSRIVQLTTNQDGVVLDPFSGSGTVPTVSHILGRSYIGIELNPAYVKMFEKHLTEKKLDLAQQSLPLQDDATSQALFSKTIADLRVLKFGRLILRALRKEQKDGLQLFVFRLPDPEGEKFKLYAAEYCVVLPSIPGRDELIRKIELLVEKPPFSKFGIKASIKFIRSKAQLDPTKKSQVYYRYTHSNSHANLGALMFSKIPKGNGELLSPVKVDVEEPND